MKKLIITEYEKKEILRKYSIMEQSFIKKLFTNYADNILRFFSDDAVKSLDDLLRISFKNSKNFFEKGGKLYIVSANPNTIPIKVDDLNLLINGVTSGKISAEKVLEVLPSYLADGTEFRKPMEKILKMKRSINPNMAQEITLEPDPAWTKRWFSNNKEGKIATLFEKIKKLEKIPFNPKNVKIVNRAVLDSVENGVFKQRPVIEINVTETGDNFLVYSSTGTGAPELKQKGDWQLLAGWKPYDDNPNKIRWYIKDEFTTQLTKGLNQWATELDKFIKKNGVDALGK